ncbi:MAG: GNAT family N-acetyltransferase [Acidimicrobiia bacterium]|nr:GNAT family N-acetyltransferase [Acidimicrobiia bacterium]MDH5292658.1 GNAT family N-acetyltransferase [Acidimicrobiia bacterium]
MVLIGRYHILSYERPTEMERVRADKAIRLATEADLKTLKPLLAPGIDHGARLRDGNVCVWAAAPDGKPVGLQWVNFTGHPDPHFGALSRPDSVTAYLNQIVVEEGYRIRGYAPRVMIASIVAARDAGFGRVRGLVATSNETMKVLVEGLGFELCGVQRGVRIGPRLTFRRS